MPDNESEEGTVLLRTIESLEQLVRDLKRRVVAAGNNEAMAAGIILEADERDHLPDAFQDLCDDAANTAWDVSDDLFEFLENYDRTRNVLLQSYDPSPSKRDAFWKGFHKEVKALKSTNAIFRKRCLFRTYETGHTLFHEVCKRNPTVEVIETLIDVTPVNEEKEPTWGINEEEERILSGFIDTSQYNHLACSQNDNEHPLHMVMRHGGSAEVVKLLINADVEKKTLRSSPDGESRSTSLLHLLIANKEHHQPDEFSSILRLIVDSGDLSPLLEEKARYIQTDISFTPVGLLMWVLQHNCLRMTDILKDDDFIFLTKATCYQHSKMHSRRAKTKSPRTGYGERLKKIGRIPLSHAFLVCSSCFDGPSVAVGLRHLFSLDPSILLEKNVNGQHPFHQIVHDRFSYRLRYFVDVDCDKRRGQFMNFIIKLILKLAPLCAKQVDDEGRLPLQIAADLNRLKNITEEQRLELVQIIWNAYPDAAGIMDKETGLPAFALSMREVENERMNQRPAVECCLSSAFFLLRKHPEIVSGFIASGKGTNQVSDCTPAKRQKLQHQK